MTEPFPAICRKHFRLYASQPANHMDKVQLRVSRELHKGLAEGKGGALRSPRPLVARLQRLQ